ncbi:MAG TPA: acetyl-CoA synthetase [Porphyromonadaceae bacterium]|nr:AMP-binding protein [Paramuribaculum sp.]HAB41689.1 acetyl-CoA synthetase [Porphyromonadaceae bacterium]
MIENFLKQTDFESHDDFMRNFKVQVPDNFNFGYDVVDAWAAAEPDRPALLWTDAHGREKRFTFADIKRESDRTAAFFKSLGIGKGDMVMLILKRRYQFWFSMIALHKLGAVAIPATHLLTPHDIIYRCTRAGIKAIVCAGEQTIIDHVEQAMPECPTVKALISTGPVIPEGWHDFDKGIAEAPEFKPELPVNSNSDVSLLYFTSGTTGEPKMVAHDFTYPLGHIVTATCWHHLDTTSRHLTVADTGWGKAVWGKLYGQWIAGAEVFVYDFDKFIPADILRVLSDYHITSFCAPPTIFRFLIHDNVGSYDLSSLRHCTIAGEALNPSVYEEWLRLTGIKLMEGFGQTETTLTIGTFPWMDPKPGSMGRPGPQYRIDLVDADGHPVADGEEGEIVIHIDGERPLGLFREYLHDPQLTAEACHDGLYHTGDVATRDADGYYWFVGRTDDVIKSSGYRIGPFEVESALMSHPAVVECAITGVPDEIRGQIIKATIVLAEPYRDADKEALTKEIQDHVKKATAPYKYPRVVEFVDELPKTISGKIRRAAIRAQYRSRNNPETLA